MSSSPTPLAWVHKRDGRLVPFEADRISRALFAAAESLGQPDAFLARELTDSILHFLRVETSGSAPTTAQIADLVIKVVRELGQPALARAFADAQTRKAESGKQAEEDQRQNPAWKAGSEGWDVRPGFRSAPSANTGPTPLELAQWIEQLPSPASLVWRAGRACLSAYTLREVYTRDLVAAQSAGLLTLMGLDTPLELGAQVLGITGTTGTELVETLEEARGFAGEYVALDGPEYLLRRPSMGKDAIPLFIRELAIGLRITHLQAVINLNSVVPPPWANSWNTCWRRVRSGRLSVSTGTWASAISARTGVRRFCGRRGVSWEAHRWGLFSIGRAVPLPLLKAWIGNIRLYF
jgi:hypothetical protein